MKRWLCLMLTVLVMLHFAACANGCGTNTPGENAGDEKPTAATTEELNPRVLVVYFSGTGNTKAAANRIAARTGCRVYEIVPAEPYSAADLDYNDLDCRAYRERNDEACRPAIAGEALDLSDYDTVILGYPIWFGTLPRILETFLDAYDLSGKTVLPFCTSGGSGISASAAVIRNAEPGADVKDGLRANGVSDEALAEWLRSSGVACR